MAKQWLMLLVEVDEDQFTAKDTYTALPNAMNIALHKATPCLTLDAVYVVGLKQKQRLVALADATATDYHHYAVSVRGEKCTEANCEEHAISNVLNTYDHNKRSQTPPGIN
jgi:hypothetical protein